MPLYRKLNGIKIISPYVTDIPQTGFHYRLLETVNLGSGLILARTVTEDDRDILAHSSYLLKDYVEILADCAEAKDHLSSDGFYPEEILDTLTELASIDDVKKKLIDELRILESIWTILANVKRRDAIPAATKLLWVLSFDASAQKVLLDKDGNGWEDFLEELLANRPPLQLESQNAIEGILWNLSGTKVADKTKNNRIKEGKGREAISQRLLCIPHMNGSSEHNSGHSFWLGVKF